MLRPLIQRPRRSSVTRPRERGVTMALVALAIFGIIAMAALSIDIGTLYQGSAEAQRAADAAALAAARVLSLSGMTGDPTNKSGDWIAACNAATLAAQAVGSQNTVAGAAPTVAIPTYSATDGSSCTSSAGNYAFGVNPMVTVKVSRSNLPTYFSRIWGSAGSSVSATATAEVFNPSNSGAFSSSGNVVPVEPHCVKPWLVPNRDPGSGACVGTCPTLVGPLTGPTPSSITNGGITGSSAPGVIGETFNLAADCGPSGNCNSIIAGPALPYYVSPAPANGGNVTATTPNLEYLPGEVLGAPKAAPSSCSAGSYQQAIAGCDQTTPYQCGVQAASLGPSANMVDLAENPVMTGDTATAAGCLTKNGDTLSTSVYPYQITAGGSNPVASGSVITSSNSIVSFPIYDDNQALMINGSNEAPVTIVGFLQVFINMVNTDGSLNVTVLNVAGCGEGVSSSSPGYINGTSPVPVRLITPP
jgi:Flp pilus assembly protein TadG